MSSVNVTDYSVPAWWSVSTGEWVVLGIGSVSCVFILIACTLIIIHRKYPPLKAKQPLLIFVSGLASVIMFVGNAQDNRVFPQQGPFLQCTLFGIWMNWTLGVFLSVDLILFRMLRLYWIFAWRKILTTQFNIVGFSILFLPMFIIAVVSSALSLNGPVWLPTGIYSCDFQDSFYYPMYLYAAYILSVCIFLTVVLRKVPKKFFSDYREDRNILIVFICCFVVAIPIAASNYSEQVGARIISMLMVIVASNTVFWTLCAVPLYYSIVNPQWYNQKFMDALRDIADVRQDAKTGPSAKAPSSSLDLEVTSFQNRSDDLQSESRPSEDF